MTVARYQNPNAQVQEGLAVAHTIHGSPSAGLTPTQASAGALEGKIAAVPQAHMSNYRAPKRRYADKGAELCAFEGCKAYPSKKYAGYCAGHAVTMGLRENPKLVAQERERHDDAE